MYLKLYLCLIKKDGLIKFDLTSFFNRIGLNKLFLPIIFEKNSSIWLKKSKIE